MLVILYESYDRQLSRPSRVPRIRTLYFGRLVFWGDWHFESYITLSPGSKCGFDRFEITDLIKNETRDA